MSSLCAISFFTFGVLLKDPAIYTPNAIGIVLSFTNIITMCVLPKEKPEIKEKEKDIENAHVDFNKIKTVSTEIEKEKNFGYKIPNPDPTEENNIGITDRDQPAAYSARTNQDDNPKIRKKSKDDIEDKE